MKKPILSISILCSGRKETKKCLDSLQNLRKRVPSELILVDTGCDEEMKKLLKEYADQVIPFSWCNDFSKARNAGLAAARGYWFMYLDDDEWFIDTKAIEEFFISGEYQEYGSANYYVRNYADYDEKLYKDAYATRLTFISRGVKFKGAVHETFFPLFSPIKLLPSIAKHFGYVFKTEEERRKHSERNIILLENALPKERDNLRIWIHLVQEYLTQRNYRKLKEFCKEALREFEKNHTPSADRDRGCFYCGILEAEWYLSEYDEMKEDYEKALSDQHNTDYCTAQLMTYGLNLAVIRREKENAAECCERYLALWEKYKSKPDELMLQGTPVVDMAFHAGNRNRVFCYQICMDLEKGNTDSLRRYFDQFGWDEKQVLMSDEFFPGLVKAMAELPYQEIFTHTADILANRPDMEKFWVEVEKIEVKEQLPRLGRIFSGVKILDFDRYQQIVDTYMWNASKKKIENLQVILENGTENRDLSTRQRYFLLKLEEAAVIRAGWEESATEREANEDSGKTNTERRIDSSSGESKSDTEWETDRSSGESDAERGVDGDNREIGTERGTGVDSGEPDAKRKADRDKKEKMSVWDLLASYTENCLGFYGEFFQERAFEGEMEFLPVSCRTAVKLQKLLDAQEKDNWGTFSDIMKEIAAIAPEFSGTLKEYARLYASQRASGKKENSGSSTDIMDTKAEKSQKAVGAISGEMEMLAKQVKEQIPVLLSHGMKEQALQALRQLGAVMPDDPELKELEISILGNS